ncbi:MAG: sulfatase-like hydrolase/transferase, partial [Planctomycetota bacterium]
AVEFLKEPPKEEPYFLAAGIYRPHLPFYAPRKYFDMYPLDKVELPPMKADDLDDLPAPGKRMAATRRGDYELLLKYGRHREFVQAYLANISYGDALVGRLLDALDRSGQAENTIIVFWSDHGWHLGEKQHLHKFTLWERSTRVPFIIVAPGVTKPGSRCDKPVGGIDILPTLLDLCSLPALNGIDGISLTPLLKNPKREWRAAVTTHGQGNHAVRTERWRYIRYSNGDEELYDHNSDPNEWTNLAKKPELAKFKSKLSESLPKTNAKPQRDNRPKRKGKKKKKKKS